MMEPVLARNVSVRSGGDVKRVQGMGMTSLRATPSPRGDRQYVGEHQVVTVTIVTAEEPTAVAVSLAKIPTRAMPYSTVRVDGKHSGATIEEFHDATHVWSRTQVWFVSNGSNVSQEFLLV
jgi:hypothetical protein